MTARPTRVAVLISGTGRTLTNLLERIDRHELDVNLVAVVSDRPGVRGLDIAREVGIETHVLPPRDYNFVWEDFSKALNYELEAHEPDLIVMAGFLSLYKIPATFTNRVMNIHPSLLPSFAGKGFYGNKVHRAVLDRGVRYTGCTVHFANNDYDQGPIILQEIVPVEHGDTVETLAAKVFVKECEAYPRAIRWFHEGRLEVEGNRVRVLDDDELAQRIARRSTEAPSPDDSSGAEAPGATAADAGEASDTRGDGDSE